MSAMPRRKSMIDPVRISQSRFQKPFPGDKRLQTLTPAAIEVECSPGPKIKAQQSLITLEAKPSRPLEKPENNHERGINRGRLDRGGLNKSMDKSIERLGDKSLSIERSEATKKREVAKLARSLVNEHVQSMIQRECKQSGRVSNNSLISKLTKKGLKLIRQTAPDKA